MADNDLVTSKEAARYLGVCPATIMKWRVRNRYNLPFIRIGRMCKYRLSDLAKFLENHTFGLRRENAEEIEADMNYAK